MQYPIGKTYRINKKFTKNIIKSKLARVPKACSLKTNIKFIDHITKIVNLYQPFYLKLF